jgi:hypothetical protein
MTMININYAFNGFLYAPLMLADALGFFPKNTRLVYRNGDVETIKSLCIHSSDNEKNWFAICDPFPVDISTIIPEHTDDELCVVGTLIDKLPVWIYNTNPNIIPVNSEESLWRYTHNVFKMVCYKEGTTGYLLAKRLQRLLNINCSSRFSNWIKH